MSPQTQDKALFAISLRGHEDGQEKQEQQSQMPSSLKVKNWKMPGSAPDGQIYSQITRLEWKSGRLRTAERRQSKGSKEVKEAVQTH